MTMSYPLLVPRILERASDTFPNKQVITRVGEGTHRCSYRDLAERVARLSNALSSLGVGVGDRVGTFAWNTYRHLEVYFAIPGMGAVAHTINIRLSLDDITYIINHAEDKALLIDPDLLPIIEAIAPRLESVKHFVVMSDDAEAATSLPSAYSYEAMLSQSSPEYNQLCLDEMAPAGLCYTSATTGRPKGVMYSHRALLLHSMAQCQADTLAFSEQDTVMPLVPMFHANCWGIPYSSVMVGANLVMAGARPDSRSICELIHQERVTYSAGVPTIWVGVLDYIESSGKHCDFSSVREILSGGSAVPVSLIRAYRDKLGVSLVHAYGMTETTPLVTYNRLKSSLQNLSDEERLKLAGRQGLLVPGLEMKILDDQGQEVARDGQQRGELLLRGPWVAKEYYHDERSAETFIDGWCHSGDIVTVDSEGYVQVVDRVKDMVKSGGEWISSVDLEAAIMAHPSVLEATVIGVPHPTWQERPLACVVPKAQFRGLLDQAQVLDFIRDRFARWWLPDEVIFLDEIPKTSVGKFDKKALREHFHNHILGG